MSSVLVFAGCSGKPETVEKEVMEQETENIQEAEFSDMIPLEQAQKNFLDSVSIEYSYDIANKLAEIKSNPNLGYRTAGSKAEFEAGELLKKEMENIGLEVTKDAFTLDTWEFEKARLTYVLADGTSKTVELGGYQTNFNTEGTKEFSVVYGGRGTPEDLDGLDVTGKLVLIDINQREDWWITYPAFEANLHGAAAVLAAQNGGYSEVSPDALNSQDICGKADAPAFSISRTDADIIKGLLEESPDKEIKVELDAKSVVTLDGTSYNIVGTIPGKNPDSMVLVSAHYDSYFDGFQDDNAAIGLMLGIAKAIKDSGYTPEKTLVFCAMAAEEWGASNTRYDWSTGAYNQIFNVHPEWAGKVVANINFELPAMNEGDTDQIRSSYELKTFTEAFIPKIPVLDGVFPNGVEVIVPTQTWSDDFSLSIAGVPANVTALRSDFARTHYHSQFDNKDTYSPEAFTYHHNMYGMLLMEYDRCAVSPLDFVTRLEELKESIDKDVMSAAGVDTTELETSIDKAIEAANNAYKKVLDINTEYNESLNNGNQTDADRILAENNEINAQILSAFKFAQDSLVRLTWEDVSIFPHQHSQNNLSALTSAVDSLSSGNASEALDEYLYLVDNNWYAYDWSKETFTYFTDYVLKQPSERLFWGAGRVQGHEDLFDVIASLKSKADTQNPDYSEEITALTNAVSRQTEMLNNQIKTEVESVNKLAELLNEIK